MLLQVILHNFYNKNHGAKDNQKIILDWTTAYFGNSVGQLNQPLHTKKMISSKSESFVEDRCHLRAAWFEFFLRASWKARWWLILKRVFHFFGITWRLQTFANLLKKIQFISGCVQNCDDSVQLFLGFCRWYNTFFSIGWRISFKFSLTFLSFKTSSYIFLFYHCDKFSW